MEDKVNAYSVLVGKPEGGRSLAEPRHKWEDNIKMDHKETGWEALNWIHLACDRENGGLL
jgi:hypothetical protein